MSDELELLWKCKTIGEGISEVWLSSAVADGKVYIGSLDNYVYCFGVKKATLSIDSNPSASVYINDSYEGITPLSIELEKGEYNIRIEKENYENYNETIELSPGESKNISVELNKITPPPTTPMTTTHRPATTLPPTTMPPQQSNSFMYLGIFIAILFSVFAVCQITKKKK